MAVVPVLALALAGLAACGSDDRANVTAADLQEGLLGRIELGDGEGHRVPEPTGVESAPEFEVVCGERREEGARWTCQVRGYDEAVYDVAVDEEACVTATARTRPAALGTRYSVCVTPTDPDPGDEGGDEARGDDGGDDEIDIDRPRIRRR